MTRRSSNEILGGLKEGHMYGRDAIVNITRTLVCSKISELTRMEQKDNEDWCEGMIDSIGGSNPNNSYLHVIREIREQAAEGMIDHESLLYLSSLFFAAGRTADAFMNIAVIDLLSAAGMEEEYDFYFKIDTELFRSVKGREPLVRDVLRESFDQFRYFKPNEVIDPMFFLNNRPYTQSITRPFFRCEYDYDIKMIKPALIKAYAVDWVWSLMVEAPERILRQNRADKEA